MRAEASSDVRAAATPRDVPSQDLPTPRQNHPDRRVSRPPAVPATPDSATSKGHAGTGHASPASTSSFTVPRTSRVSRLVVPDAKELHGAPAAALAMVDPTEPDRLFVMTQGMGADGIVAFVTALCRVSERELLSSSAPRVYSLAKIVEVAHHNMGRIRLVWSRIWHVLGDFFTWVGCHPRQKVALYAVDALRQLR